MIADTQPHRSLLYRPRPVVRRGCAFWGIIIACIFAFSCGICSLTYLLFPPPPLNILILGLNSRPGEGMITRADTIMLMGVQPGRLRVSLLSIPRDLFIVAGVYGEERINTIHMLGEMEEAGRGVTLMEESIAAAFAIPVDRYARLDFHAFVELIDAVGGVTVDVPRVIEDYEYPLEDGSTIHVRFEPGVQHLNGAQALIYARTRHGDDDYSRAARQQQVVTALSLQLIQPQNWVTVVSVLSRQVETDLSIIDMLRVAPAVLLSAGRFERLVVDRSYITATANGNPTPNVEALRDWLDERFD